MPAALGAGIGGGVLLLIVGLRGVTVDPTRPPSRADRGPRRSGPRRWPAGSWQRRRSAR